MGRELLEAWAGKGTPLTLEYLQAVVRVELDDIEADMKSCPKREYARLNKLRIQLTKMVEAGRGVLTDATLSDLKTRLDQLEKLVKQGRAPIDEVLESE
jgi:hypothetical protein